MRHKETEGLKQIGQANNGAAIFESSVKVKRIRLRNARIDLGRFDDRDAWALSFKRLGDRSRGEPRVVITSLMVSNEALEAVIDLHRAWTGPAAGGNVLANILAQAMSLKQDARIDGETRA